MKKKFFHSIWPLFGIFLFAVALWVLHHELREYHYHDVLRHLAEIPAHGKTLKMGKGLDLISKKEIPGEIILEPYQFMWVNYSY